MPKEAYNEFKIYSEVTGMGIESAFLSLALNGLTNATRPEVDEMDNPKQMFRDLGYDTDKMFIGS